MQWRVIPEYPVYEINERGRIRKTATRYVIQVKGKTALLWIGGNGVRCAVAELVASAFAPLNSRASIPPRSTPLPSPKGFELRPEPTVKKLKPKQPKSAGFYEPTNPSGRHRMNLPNCPWAKAQIRGEAMGADPVLGF